MAERLEYKLLGTKGGTLQAGYNLGYTIADNCQQIANIAEQSYRTEGTGAAAPKNKVSQFSYDANGNLLCINTGTKNGNKLLATNNRKLLWDEENRLLASCDNGFVTSYGYDASGERTYKMSGDGEGVNINGVVSGGRTATTNYTAYINPYMVARSGSEYTKHIYAGSQRIVSQICSYILNPLTAPKAGGADYSNQYNAQTAAIKARYDSVGIAYKGVNNAGANFFTAKTVTQENLQYFYHPDHLGSTSLITDLSGGLVQHLEYVPYGETFIDERRSASSWTTPYLFSAKERDDETGLYYYGARYYDPRTSVWVSVDPLAEKYPSVSPYVYCLDNPVNHVDPDGRLVIFINGMHTGDGGTTKYWNQLDSKVMARIGDQHTRYYDGALGGINQNKGFYGSNLSASTRKKYGEKMGYSQAAEIFNSLKDGETIKLVTHSMGGAYGKGLLKGLQKYAKENKIDFRSKVEFEVDLAPFQPTHQMPNNDVKTIVIAHKWDNVAGSEQMPKAENHETRQENFSFWGLPEHSVDSFTPKEINKFVPASSSNGTPATWEQNGNKKQQK